VRQIILNTPPAGIIGALKGMAVRPDSTHLLPTIDIPVLVVTGDKDQLILPANAQTMANAISMATLTSVEDAGHMPMLEKPEATTTAIRHFLNAMAGVTFSAS
jgi:3-oxoadipate enol-lactonase